MKALLIHGHGGLERVCFEEVEKPRCRSGHVLVRTKAAALNHLDLFVLKGMPGLKLNMPHILGSDGAGVVEVVGEGVTHLSTGDRVMLNACLWCGRCEFCIQGEQSLCIKLHLVGEHSNGTYAQFFLVPAANLEKIPENTSFQAASAFSLVFQTAWRMLTTRARIRPGEDVFIHGIGGGVSSAALQIVKLCGGRVFVSSSSDEKLKQAEKLGADYCYNYTKEDVASQVLRQTTKRGVDLVVDSVGRSTWPQSLRMVRRGGRIVSCGATTGFNPESEIGLIFWKQIDILGSTMSNRWEYRKLIALLAQGKLKPVIAKTFPLAQGKRALEYLKSGRQFGKIVLVAD